MNPQYVLSNVQRGPLVLDGLWRACVNKLVKRGLVDFTEVRYRPHTRKGRAFYLFVWSAEKARATKR